jgi:hypothetical protein
MLSSFLWPSFSLEDTRVHVKLIELLCFPLINQLLLGSLIQSHKN